MHLFLDTSIYLGFYELSKDNLEELRKLVVTVKNGQTVLYHPKQVRDEFARRREGVIAAALKTLGEAKLPDAFPQLVRTYPEFDELQLALKNYDELRAKLLKTAREAATAQKLDADKLIDSLFKLGTTTETTDDILTAARRRVDMGNPPGKERSFGDAINWESLLITVPKQEDLLLVTADGDYMSRLEPDLPSRFLKLEWRAKKKANITVYRQLGALFADKYPTIKLARDLEKELAITALRNSANYEETHRTLAKLSGLAPFTPEQAREILVAAITNDQIYWIAEDGDVNAFYMKLIAEFSGVLDDDERQHFWSAFG